MTALAFPRDGEALAERLQMNDDRHQALLVDALDKLHELIEDEDGICRYCRSPEAHHDSCAAYPIATHLDTLTGHVAQLEARLDLIRLALDAGRPDHANDFAHMPIPDRATLLA